MAGTNATSYDKQWDKTIPTDAPEVARIMRARGVGRRRATHLLAKERAESIDVSDVTLSQKEMVLAAVIDGAGNSNDLIKALPEVGGHDVMKLLWACQKSGWITFRERKSGGYGKVGDRPKVYAIRVTDKGYEAHGRKRLEQAADDGHPVAVEVQAAIKESEEEPARRLPILDIRDYPLIEELGHRAALAEKLNLAARILEEAGEEDMALQVMGKTEFTPLEQDVIRLIKDALPKEA